MTIKQSVALCSNMSTVQVNPGSKHFSKNVNVCEGSRLALKDIRDVYDNFVSKGTISLNPTLNTPCEKMSDNRSIQDIVIVRDTGASQTLLLEGVLALEEFSVTGNVLLEG